MCMENGTRKEAECDADMRDVVGRGVSASDDMPLARAADGACNDVFAPTCTSKIEDD